MEEVGEESPVWAFAEASPLCVCLRELVHHLGQQVQRLGVLSHAVGDHLCRSHHLLAKMADVSSSVLGAGGHRLDGGPEFLHAALCGELWMLLPVPCRLGLLVGR